MSEQDVFEAIDVRCGTTHNTTALSVFSASTAGVLMLFSIPLNIVIVYCIIKVKKNNQSRFFYKLLLNIALIDLISSISANTAMVSATTKEALRMKVGIYEATAAHFVLFFTDSVALTIMTILSIERLMLLAMPIKHHKGIKPRSENIFITAAWPFSLLLTAPYIKLKFIKQLALFSTVNVILCILSLIITIITYKKKTSNRVKAKVEKMHPVSTDCNPNQNISPSVQEKREEQKSQLSTCSTSHTHTDEHVSKATPINNKNTSSGNTAQNKATRTFIYMLCVFVVTYLPTSFSMLYMNVCVDCNCIAIHAMRDISILSILSSSLLRPLNFLLTLKHLRVLAKKLGKDLSQAKT